MNESIHEALMDFLMAYAPEERWFFNYNHAAERCFSVVPDGGEEFIERWIDGGGLCRYDFTVSLFCGETKAPFMPGEHNKAAADVAELEGLMRWLLAQSRIGNFPALPEGRRAQAFELPGGTPENAGDDAVRGVVRLSFPARLVYLREGE